MISYYPEEMDTNHFGEWKLVLGNPLKDPSEDNNYSISWDPMP